MTSPATVPSRHDAADGVRGRCVPARGNVRRPSLVFALLCTAEFIVVVDFSITTVALNPIRASLGFSASGLQWVVNAYGVAIATMLLLGGRAADAYGRRRMFLFGLTLFTAASLAGGFAPTAGLLIAGRAVQGVGAAFMSPAALALLVATASEPQARARALGVWGAVGSAGVGAGLLVGGLILRWASWRWVFWVNVPLGATTVYLGWRLLPGDLHHSEKSKTLDVGGAALATGGVLLAVYALAHSQDAGLLTPVTIVVFLTGLALLAGFLAFERHATAPMLPPGFFLRYRGLLAANLLSFTANAELAATFVILSLHLTAVVSLSPLATGLALLPMAGSLVVASGLIAPPAIARLGARRIGFLGLITNAAGLTALALVLPGTGQDWALPIIPSTVAIGFGYGLAFPAWTAGGVDSVPDTDQGLAGGILTSAQEVGAALGLALLAAVSAAAGGRDHSMGAVTTGHQAAFATAAGIAIVGALIALRLPGQSTASYATPASVRSPSARNNSDR